MRNPKSVCSCLLILAALLCGLSAVPVLAADDDPVYKTPTAPLESRVEDLLGRLTLQEKLELVGGTGFATRAIERLGVPAMGMCDGPIGDGVPVRDRDGRDVGP